MATVGPMTTRLYSVVFDAADPAALARFWSGATGWPITYEEPDEVVVEPPEDESGTPTEPGLPLVFVRVDDPKVVKNRVHIDLDSRSPEQQAALVEQLLQAGATHADIGQRGVPWVVLADPEGNELCVLDPRDDYARAGAIAAVVLDTPDPAALAPFWAAATGWRPEAEPDGDMRLVRPDGRGPHLELLRNDVPKVAKNRVHIDVAPTASDDQAAEVERLRALGATDADVGQGSRSWVVLADPHGNELCVLSPRD
jgi:hypothetical protein